MTTPEPGEFYQHRYGGLYRVDSVALSTIDKAQWVVYTHVYPFEVQTWVRPYDEWTDGRFRKLASSEVTTLRYMQREEFQNQISAAKAESKR